MTRDEAIAMIKDDLLKNGEYLSGKYRKALLMATDALKLGIVRCGECIDYQNGECKSNLLHWLMDGNVAEVAFRPNNDFYCKYGLRKDGRIE